MQTALASSKKPIIRVRGLHKYFGDDHIIKGVNLDVRSGEVVVIIGPTGTGKSTFLRCLNFLEESSAGTIEVAGIQVDVGEPEDRREEDIRAIRRQAAMVFQDFNLFPHKTVLENIILGATKVKKVPKEEAIAMAETLLKGMNLLARRNDFPAQLSVGEQQQVAIARSLCMEPQVLLFDDPTSALDPVLVHELVDTLTQLAGEGISMIVVTNEPYLARSTADLVIFMDGGVWSEIAPPDLMFSEPKRARTRQFLEHILLKDISLSA
jgi:ABC-type polar amino acid transport system ATPase subunit